MQLVRGNFKVEWIDLEEGLHGDYDPNDPEDVALLRFDISRKENGEWVPVNNGNYCTLFPVDAPESQKRAALEHIMDKVHSPLKNGQSIKNICEPLSWIEPDWIEDDDAFFSA